MYTAVEMRCRAHKIAASRELDLWRTGVKIVNPAGVDEVIAIYRQLPCFYYELERLQSAVRAYGI